jgi:hypothetical protein
VRLSLIQPHRLEKPVKRIFFCNRHKPASNCVGRGVERNRKSRLDIFVSESFYPLRQTAGADGQATDTYILALRVIEYADG